MLKNNRYHGCLPTLYPDSEEVSVGRFRLRLYDVGGHTAARTIWKNYFCAIDGIIFVVDAADPTRFPEVTESLWKILDDPSLHGLPLVILGNKTDHSTAASQDELRRALLMFSQVTWGVDRKHERGDGKGRPVELFMASVVRRHGYDEALRWLCQFMA